MVSPVLKMTDRAAIVDDFWLAILRNDWAGGEAAVSQILAQLVSILASYSFELVQGDEQETGREKRIQVRAESPRAVMPDTPMATVDAWNAEVEVLLVTVSKRETCGARLTDGKVNFLACAGPMDQVGGTLCG